MCSRVMSARSESSFARGHPLKVDVAVAPLLRPLLIRREGQDRRVALVGGRGRLHARRVVRLQSHGRVGPHEKSALGKRTIQLGIDVEEAETAISEGTNPPETRAGSPRRGGWRWARDALFQREVQGLDTGQTCIYPLVDLPTTSAEHKL